MKTTTPAIAGPIDPILGWAARRREIQSRARALSEQIEDGRASFNGDIAGTGWPPVDEELHALGMPFHYFTGKPIRRDQIEGFNRHTESIVSGFKDWSKYQGEPAPDASADVIAALRKRQSQGRARLAWWDRRQAERERNAETIGYSALCEQQDSIYKELRALEDRILETPAVTLAGAMAKLELAADVVRRDNTDDGELQEQYMDTEDLALLAGLDDLKRLLPQIEGSAI